MGWEKCQTEPGLINGEHDPAEMRLYSPNSINTFLV